jgi:phage/plasmid-like protein (TIGR03299 family)
MPAYFEQGFFVRKPAWHGLGVVLDDYPGREEAMRLAGHDFDIVERDLLIVGDEVPGYSGSNVAVLGNETRPVRQAKGWKAHLRSDNLSLLHVSRETFKRIPNEVAYDFAEMLLDQGFRYETGITLKGGAVCAITLLLDEPITITGDDTVTLPYLGLSWAHDGSAALRGRSTTVRQVCANTVAASEIEGARLGTDFSIRHTKNWRDRVEDARLAISGVRRDVGAYREVMEAFASMPVTPDMRSLFAQAIVLDQTVASVSRFKGDCASGKYSPRVQTNVENAAASVMALFNGETIPDEHRFTAYGLHLAGVEYLDHIRTARTQDTRVGRSLLRDEPAKARLPQLIRELVAA